MIEKLTLEITSERVYASYMPEGNTGGLEQNAILSGNLIGKDAVHPVNPSRVTPLNMTERQKQQVYADTGRFPPGTTQGTEDGKINRREAIKKGGLAIGGILAAAAGVFGFGKALEKALGSKVGSQEQGIQTGQNAASSAKRQLEVHGIQSGGQSKPTIIDVPTELK